MASIALILNFLMFILPGTYVVNSHQPAAASLPDDEQKKAFSEAFMKCVNSSFYTSDFMEAFSDLRDGKAIIDKHYSNLIQYKTKLEFPGKTCDAISYIPSDKKANIPLSSKYKEVSEAKLDFETNVSWVREALGSSYVEREINNDSNRDYPNHFIYFYRSGVDTSNKYAFHVEVAYMFSGKKGESEIVIYSQQKN